MPGGRRTGLIMATRDPYTVLGISKSASADEVKKAYRRLAKKLHPDQNTTDPKAFTCCIDDSHTKQASVCEANKQDGAGTCWNNLC